MKKPNQKAKLLYLYDYLSEYSDAEHPVSVTDMINHLERCGINAERKSIYTDLEELTNFGVDIIKVKTKTTGYFIGERKFEYAELLLLADAVQSSRFITEKKSRELISKLRSLTSRYKAPALAGGVYVSNRVKTMNESIYYNVDTIAEAIEKKSRIFFYYFNWTSNKEKVLRHGGKKYSVVPLDLIWSDENFYLVGYDDEAGKIKHFRVDKTEKITIGDRITREYEKKIAYSPENYNEMVFGMFGGESVRVTIACDESLAGVFIDRFGKNIVLRKTEGGFETTVGVEISPVFLSWVASFGNKAKIISPESVIEKYKTLLSESLEQY